MENNDVFYTENIGDIEDAVHSIYESLADLFEKLESSICEIAEKLGEIIGCVDWTKFFQAVEECEISRKSSHNFPEYKYTKPNTKPLFVTQRLHRVQART